MRNPIDRFFSEVKDPRTGGNVRYPLNEILLVAVVSLLCGGRSYADMVDTCRAKRRWLEQYFAFEHGIPSEDTFRYVLMLLDPRQFGDCFAQWMRFLHGHVEGLVAIDGKACRGTGAIKGNSMLTVVNAYCRERGVVLASIDTADKSNEITVLPQLLRALNVKGCVVTLDAMGCQKPIASQIVDQEGDYLISLKGNQGNLHVDVAEFFEAHEQSDPGFREPDFEADVYEYEEENRGRHYRRKIVATSDFCPGLESYKKQWKGLGTVVRMESWRTQNDTTTHEVRYAISPAWAGPARGEGDCTGDAWSLVRGEQRSLDARCVFWRGSIANPSPPQREEPGDITSAMPEHRPPRSEVLGGPA